MLETTLGCLKWAAVGFVVAFALMKLFEASHIHDDIPKPAFKIRQTKRATYVLSTFAAMLSALVWLLVAPRKIGILLISAVRHLCRTFRRAGSIAGRVKARMLHFRNHAGHVVLI